MKVLVRAKLRRNPMSMMPPEEDRENPSFKSASLSDFEFKYLPKKNEVAVYFRGVRMALLDKEDRAAWYLLWNYSVPWVKSYMKKIGLSPPPSEKTIREWIGGPVEKYAAMIAYMDAIDAVYIPEEERKLLGKMHPEVWTDAADWGEEAAAKILRVAIKRLVHSDWW